MVDLQLFTCMGSAQGWGSAQGQQTYASLQRSIALAPPQESIYRISLAGIERIDVPFCRETLIALASRYQCQRGVCLTDIRDPDILANVDGAAWQVRQPIIVWGHTYTLLGPLPSVGLRPVLAYALAVPSIRTSEVAATLGMQINNASNALSHLWQQGYLLRQEQSAPSGGKEYLYYRIQ